MKFKCLVDTCFLGIDVKANETIVDIEWDISETNPNWYKVEESSVKAPVRPRISRIKK